MPFKKLTPFIIFFAAFILTYCTSQKPDVKTEVKAHLLNQINALDSSAVKLQSISATGNEQAIQQAFLKTRRGIRNTYLYVLKYVFSGRYFSYIFILEFIKWAILLL